MLAGYGARCSPLWTTVPPPGYNRLEFKRVYILGQAMCARDDLEHLAHESSSIEPPAATPLKASAKKEMRCLHLLNRVQKLVLAESCVELGSAANRLVSRIARLWPAQTARLKIVVSLVSSPFPSQCRSRASCEARG